MSQTVCAEHNSKCQDESNFPVRGLFSSYVYLYLFVVLRVKQSVQNTIQKVRMKVISQLEEDCFRAMYTLACTFANRNKLILENTYVLKSSIKKPKCQFLSNNKNDNDNDNDNDKANDSCPNRHLVPVPVCCSVSQTVCAEHNSKCQDESNFPVRELFSSYVYPGMHIC